MSGFDVLAALAVGYLLGGFPTAAIAARLRGKRIFEVGSGNMGAMNTARNLGFGWGLAVLVVDVSKGAAAAALGAAMGHALGGQGGVPLALASISGVAAVAGHAWSPYVRFRGGKSLATAFGASLPVYPWGGVAALVLIVALLLIFRREPPATRVTIVLYAPLVYLATMQATLDQELAFTATTAALASAVLVALKQLALWLGARRRRAETPPA